MATGGQTFKAKNILSIIKIVTLDGIQPVYKLTDFNIKLGFMKILWIS
jgi:hypothetical protein